MQLGLGFPVWSSIGLLFVAEVPLLHLFRGNSSWLKREQKNEYQEGRSLAIWGFHPHF